MEMDTLRFAHPTTGVISRGVVRQEGRDDRLLATLVGPRGKVVAVG